MAIFSYPSNQRNRRRKASRQASRRKCLLESLEDRRLLAVVSHWTGDGTVSDVVGGNNATLVSGAGYDSGQIGQAFRFDGIDDRATVADNPSLALTESITVEGWVKADGPSLNSHGLILFRGDDRGGLDPYQVRVNDSGQLQFLVSSETSTASVSSDMPMGQFVHVAGTLDDATGEMSLYINGVSVASKVTPVRPFGALDATQNPGLGIGNHASDPSVTPHNFPFNGLIDELRIHDNALSAEDVLQIYNSGKGSLEPNLVVGDAEVTEGVSRFEFVDDFISSQSGGLTSPRGIDVAPSGDIFVGSDSPAQVLRYDGETGAFIEVFADAYAGADDRTGDVAIRGDYLFVTTANNDSILRFDLATGAPAPAAGLTGATFVAPGTGGLDRPFGIDFDDAGNIYAPSLEGGNVLKFDGATGGFLGVFVASESGGLGDSLDLTFGPDGNLYVADSAVGRVLRYQGPNGASPGAFMDEFIHEGAGGLTRIPADGLKFGPDGDFYVTSRDLNEVIRFDGVTGEYVETFSAAVPGTVDRPKGLSFDAEGRLILTSEITNSVVRLAERATAIVPITLSAPVPEVVSVNYATIDGTANAGSDYVAQTGTVTFQPGERFKSVVVSIIDDLTTEDQEYLQIALSQAVGAQIAGPGTITIDDNDGPIELFYDSFELGSSSNDWNGLWVEDSQNDWFRSTQRATHGNVSAEVDGRASNATLTLSNSIDLTGYDSAELTFDWLIESGFDSGEYLTLDVSSNGGSSWTTDVIRLNGNSSPENTWHSETVDLSSFASDDLLVRFRSKVSRSNEDANVDNVKITGTLAGPPVNASPTADAGADQTLSDSDGTGSEIVTLGGSGIDPDGSIVAYEWTDGAAVIGSTATISTSLSVGTHALTLTVTDNEGATGSDTVLVTVEANQGPQADAGADQTASDGDGSGDQLVSLSGSGFDSDGTFVSYQWTEGATLLGETADITPLLSVGTHALTLTVTDNGGATASDTVVVTIVANQAPTADAGGDQLLTDDGDGSGLVTLSGSGSDSDGSIVAYQWSEGSTVLGNMASLTTPLDVGTHTLMLTVTDNGGLTTSDTLVVTVAESPSGPNLSHGVIDSVSGSWQTVSLGATYNSAVIVATPRYNGGSGPGVVRVSNVTATSFDVRVDNAGASPFSGGVHFIAMEEGVYDVPGEYKLEAVKVDSSVTSGRNGGWQIGLQGYQQSYSNPVVVGQVMSANDEDWSVFWSSSNSRTNPANSGSLNVGKHVGEDSDTTRADETLGYFVIEATGSGSINDLSFSAGIGGDTIRGFDNGTYRYTGVTPAGASTAVLSSTGMDGSDGSWPVMIGSNPLPASGGSIDLTMDEDQIRDSERKHTTEQVAYFVIGENNGEGEASSQLGAAMPSIAINDPLDVNGDGYTSAIDVLHIINALNSPDSATEEGDLALDTNGDGRLSPLDALLVINRLNFQSVSDTTADSTNSKVVDNYFGDLDDEEDSLFDFELI